MPSPIAFCLGLALLGAGLGSAARAQSGLADGPVALRPMPKLGKAAEAFPRLAASGPVADRINAGLAAADARGAKAMRECLRQAPGGSWSRTVDVTMRGPQFVSFVAHDDIDCGGAHPDEYAVPLVYDLATGRPVDWTRLFPREVSGTASTTQGGDGTVLGVLASRTLRSRYLFGLKLDGECGPALDDADLHFMLWPDAKAGGLVLYQEDLPHAAQACGGPVTIPADKLSGFGTSPRLIDAIAAAHRAAH
jgi:hypothetical protein